MRTLKSLKKNKRGGLEILSALVLTGVVAFVTLALVMPIGLSLWQSVTSSISQAGWTAAANTTMTTTTTNIGSGFNLLAISPILVGAVVILTILGVGFAYIMGRGGT